MPPAGDHTVYLTRSHLDHLGLLADQAVAVIDQHHPNGTTLPLPLRRQRAELVDAIDRLHEAMVRGPAA